MKKKFLLTISLVYMAMNLPLFPATDFITDLSINNGNIYSKITEYATLECAVKIGSALCFVYFAQKLCKSYYNISAEKKFQQINDRINRQKTQDNMITSAAALGEKDLKQNCQKIHTLQDKILQLQKPSNDFQHHLQHISYSVGLNSAVSLPIASLSQQLKSIEDASKQTKKQLTLTQNKFGEQNVSIRSDLAKLQKTLENQKHIECEKTEQSKIKFAQISQSMHVLQKNIAYIQQKIRNYRENRGSILEHINENNEQLTDLQSSILYEAYLQKARLNSRHHEIEYDID